MAQEDPLRNLINALTQAGRHSPVPGAASERNLEAAIELYQAIKRNGGWVSVPDGPVLRPGSMSGRTELIRQRLIATGDLTQPDRSPGNYFDSALADGVRRFQRRHGLQDDASIGPDTHAAMNVSVSARLAQLRRNLTRLSSLRSVITADRYVLVNIPAFNLLVVDQNTVYMTSRVIVGRRDRPTPELSSRFTSADFFPVWNVPPGIALNDLIPKLTTDPAYFYREKIVVFSRKDGSRIDPSLFDRQSITPDTVRFRQDPGPGNVLGRIRLNMPNDAFIYLHDTPAKSLFSRSSRAFSSGCVRVENIVALTDWLLSLEAGSRGVPVESHLQGGRPSKAELAQAIPVHLVYLTAWASQGAIAHFRRDIYDLVQIDAEATDEVPPPDPQQLVTP